MRRFALANCVLGLLIFSPAMRGLAAGIVPQRPVLPQCRVLEGLVGTWDTQVSGGSYELFGKPKSVGRIARQWVADHHFVHERGNEHEAFMTFDPRQNMYHAWYFHSNGHVWEMTGQWTGNMNTLSLSTEVDQNQSLQRHFQVLDDKNHECTVAWTDEDGRTGIYGMFNFTRCDPASATTNSGKKLGTAILPKSLPPAEMKIFADEIGKWSLEGRASNGDKTTKINGSSVVQWLLGGQFVQTQITLQGREGEGINISGFDAAAKTYRCWFFPTDGTVSAPAVGAWDEKERTMTWKDQLTGDLVMVSKKEWINRDVAKIHTVFSRQNGDVETTQDATITRQKEK